MAKPIEGADYFVRAVDFPDATTPGAVRPNDDGTYSVYLNTRCSRETQRKALEHERRHISSDDFNNGSPLSEIEFQDDTPPEKKKKPHGTNDRGAKDDGTTRESLLQFIRQTQDEEHILLNVADGATLTELREIVDFLHTLRGDNDDMCQVWI